MQITEPGIYPAMSMADYIADPCPEPSLSRGTIERIVMGTPAHAEFDHPRMGGGERKESKAADRGSAAHGMLLGGAERIVWIEANDWRTKVAKESRDKAHENGKIPMLERHLETVSEMVGIARQWMIDLTDGAFGGIGGSAEHTMCWLDGGTWCRARPDWFLIDVIDYKTTEIKGGPDGFIKGMVASGYDIGARWQTRGLDILTGHRPRDFGFLVQEVFKPYCCYWVSLGTHMEEIGDEKIDYGLKLWRQCHQREAWPGYNPAVHYAEPPAYAVFDWEARKAQLQMRLQPQIEGA